MSEAYCQRHLDPAEALQYRHKFEKSWTRRLSAWRERALVDRAVKEALGLLPDVLRAPNSPVLLDLPCGAGRFAPLLVKHANTYVGADHSPHMLAICREVVGDRIAHFQQADARDMPFDDGAFDIACCLRLIHHFRNADEQRQILREFRRVVRGPLVLTWLDASTPKQWVHAQRRALSHVDNRRTVLTRGDLEALAGECGWELVSTRSLSGLFSGQSVAVLKPAK
ncbi:MAG: hypothetical protein CMJ85_00690 [Planctomycetes bacterium]|nr:hypothetical protein [Planctomycetota bacterium]MDP6423779.1 methyltransferase domain-containing protein [Planctomycetota bacterium]